MSLDSTLRGLAAEIGQSRTPTGSVAAPAKLRHRTGTITAYAAGDLTAAVQIGGDIVDAPFLATYSPTVGDAVSVLINNGSPLTLGAVNKAPGGGNVITGAQTAADSTSITSTTAGAGSSFVAAAADQAVAVGYAADVEAFRGVAVGPAAFVDTGADLGVAVGAGAYAGADSAVAVGNARAAGARGVSIGAGAAGNGTQGCIAVGAASAGGDNDVAVGDTAIADGTAGTVTGQSAATCVGYNTFAAAASTSLGGDATCNGVLNVAVGSNATIDSSDNATALGVNTRVDVGCNGAVAIGADHTSSGAHATAQDQFVLGTANHIVIINGKLVIADSSGGLHQIVVSTGGALSTVAYP